jgi:transposase InsO family protein
MNSEYDITNVLTPLHEKFRSGGPEDCQRPLIMHVDNGSVHTSAATEQFMSDHRMIRMPQPPYSQDLVPSDFYFFGTVQNRLEQIQASDADDFFEQLYEKLNSISVEELERVFAAWIDQVHQVSEGNGDYLT